MWAGTFAPPLRTFLNENKLIGNKVGLCVTCSGTSTKKPTEEIQNEIPGSKIISTLSLIKPLKKPNLENSNKILSFCAKLKTAYLG